LGSLALTARCAGEVSLLPPPLVAEMRNVILEFGSRTFVAEGVSTPRFTDARPLDAHLKIMSSVI
jgi:hypothetical protein